MMYNIGPEDRQRVEVLANEFADLYIEWVDAQLKSKMPDDEFTHNAIGMALFASGQTVAFALACAVWSAIQQRRHANAPNN